MKNRGLWFILIFILTGIAAFQTTSYAMEYEETNAFGKLARGITNVATSPVEIFRNVNNESKYENALYGITIGLVKGVAQTVIRLGAGVVETATFPLNFPDEFKDPIIYPEYVWEEWE